MTEQVQEKPLKKWSDEELRAEWVRLEASYQEEYEELFAKLVPKQGEAPTTYGELLRCISAIHHDLSQNGWSNITLSHFGEYYATIRGFDGEIASYLQDPNDLPVLWMAYDELLELNELADNHQCDYCDGPDVDIDKLDAASYSILLLIMERVSEAVVRYATEKDAEEGESNE